MHRKLAKYVQENLHQGYSLGQVTARLRQEGWEEQDIQKALTIAAQGHVRKSRFLLALAGLLSFVFIGIVIHLFVIAPAFVERPEYEPPILASQPARAPQETGGQQGLPGLESTVDAAPPEPEVILEEGSGADERAPAPEPAQAAAINEQVISEVLVQLGAYKLHANPFTGDLPEIEIYLMDAQETFTAVVQGNDVKVRRASAESPDAHVEVTQDAIMELATAPDAAAFEQRARVLFAERSQRGYTGTVYSGNTDLLLKGYLALYDEHKDALGGAGITGSAIAELPLAGSGLAGMFTIIIVLWGALVLRLGLGGRE
jgi:hypothetical protein